MTGLVIGKFYPPHKGHHFLIETAGAQVDRLVVIVCKKAGQSIPAEQRASWLKGIHPKAEIFVLDQSRCDDTDPSSWTREIQELLGLSVDFMFSSEEYGDEYAPLLGARHVLVDKERVVVNCSGREVRANPGAYWELLEPVVQDYYKSQGIDGRSGAQG
jgi:HTH-type transcriptional repressor of NAD biosynthesis genes